MFGFLCVSSNQAQEVRSSSPVSIKLEVEDFGGMEAYKSGEGMEPRMAWWPQWSRGGDSGWWAAQAGPEVSAAEIALDMFVPQSDTYILWVRYEDYLGKPEPIDVIVEHAGGEARSHFGLEDKATKEDTPFPWSYVWDKRVLQVKKGPAKARVAVTVKAPVRRRFDAFVLTTDTKWQPRERGCPHHAVVPPRPWNCRVTWRKCIFSISSREITTKSTKDTKDGFGIKRFVL